MKVLAIVILAALTSGCAKEKIEILDSSSRSHISSPFNPNYKPVSYSLVKAKKPEEILASLESFLNSKGYKTTRYDTFLAITTKPKDLGFLEWVRKHEKWKIKYSVWIQLIRKTKSDLYWDLFVEIRGERSGKENRKFVPKSFKETEEIIEELNRIISNKLSKKT